jgi:hypothetical protein
MTQTLHIIDKIYAKTSLKIHGQNSDWNCILKKLQRESLIPLIYSDLKKLDDIQELVPDDVITKLEDEYFNNACHNILLLKELEKILIALKNENIPVMVLKGAALLENVYSNVALRPMNDIDILVKKESLPKINIVLKKCGYFNLGKDTIKTEVAVSPYLNSAVYKKPSFEGCFLHVHWHLVNTTIPVEMYYDKIDMVKIWKEAEPTRIGGTEALTLAPHHFLIHLCEHALNHFFDKLILLYDVHIFIERNLDRFDWKKFVDETLNFNLARPAYYTLYFTTKFFETQVPDYVLERLKPAKFSFGERKFVSSVLNGKLPSYFPFLIYLAMSKGIFKKIKFIWRHIFPPLEVVNHMRIFSDSESGFAFYSKRFLNAFGFRKKYRSRSRNVNIEQGFLADAPFLRRN